MGNSTDNRFNEKLGYWKDQLLDLSRRNRLVNFRQTRSNTVQITQPTIEKLYDRLVKRERELIFYIEPGNDPGDSERTQQPPRVLKTNEINGIVPKGDVKRVLYNLRLRSRTSLQEAGVNILYVAFSLLSWTDSKYSEQQLKAPLILAPVTLTRESVLEPYTLKLLDNDVVFNPALKQKLTVEFGMKIPDIHEDYDELDIVSFFDTLTSLVQRMDGWEVIPEVYLSVFSFTKLMMYTDLQAHADVALKHPIIRALAGDEAQLPSVPNDLPTVNELDDAIQPLETFQVMDADSSQEEAIVAAKRGVSFVLQGPPGTGKSQTISNIIAELLADNKTVLFVSEKMAALEVVKKRLDACGLGQFCLELHSHKANKRTVIEELGRTLNTPPESAQFSFITELNELKQLRDELNRYVRHLHARTSSLQLTPFEVQASLVALHRAPDVNFPFPDILDITPDELLKMESLIERMADLSQVFEQYLEHPWYGCTVETVSFQLKSDIRVNFKKLQDLTTEVGHMTGQITQRIGINPPQNLEELNNLSKLLEHYQASILGLDLEAIWQRFNTSYAGIVRILKPSYWRDLRHIRQTSRDNQKLSYQQAVDALKLARQVAHSLAQNSPIEASRNAPSLSRNQTSLAEESIANESALVGRLSQFVRDISAPISFIRLLISLNDLKIAGRPFEQLTFHEVREWLQHKLDHIDELSDWVKFEAVRKEANQYHLQEFFQAVLHDRIEAEALLSVFRKHFYLLWLDAVYQQQEPLSKFNSAHHSSLIEKFWTLDEKQLVIAQKRIQQRLSEKRPQSYFVDAASSEQTKLRHELAKKRRHKSIRRLFAEIPNLLVTLKPCLLMSPLSVSQYLDPHVFSFDAVIFDEASQILPEDAIGAIMRGKRVIVVGDDKQLPPTQFFATMDRDEFTNEELAELAAFDSILEECAGIGLPQIMLRWHYRSNDESLIAFSNRHFYDNRLNTFPNASLEGQHSAIEFVYVKGGIYDRGKSRRNTKEAQKVAELVFDHFSTHPHLSLGVVAFSEVQQMAILDQLEKMRLARPEFEPFFGRGSNEPFFVKNLENVQGDERDVMFFSIGYGKDGSGKPMPMNFGPINREGGHRRLNVAITRAKSHIKVIASFRSSDLDLNRTNSYGVKLLKQYMEYAERNGNSSVLYANVDSKPDAEFDSPFEQEVYHELLKHGFTVHNQVGCSGYRIDLAIVDPEAPGRYRLGIECDGYTYHRTATARDRDRLRQHVLERLGWKMHRIWSYDWVDHRRREIEKLLEAIEQAKHPKTTMELVVTKSVTQEGEAVSQETFEQLHESSDELPPTVSVYVPHQVEDLTDLAVKSRRDPDGALVEAVERIVKQEGPVHIDLVARHIAAYYGMSRAGSRVRETTLWAAQQSSRCTIKGEFIWPVGMVTPKVRITPEGHKPRSVNHIEIEEIQEATKVCLENAFSLSQDDLISQTARLLGFKRIGDRVKNRVGKAVQELLANGTLVEKDGLIHLQK